MNSEIGDGSGGGENGRRTAPNTVEEDEDAVFFEDGAGFLESTFCSLADRTRNPFFLPEEPASLDKRAACAWERWCDSIFTKVFQCYFDMNQMLVVQHRTASIRGSLSLEKVRRRETLYLRGSRV